MRRRYTLVLISLLLPLATGVTAAESVHPAVRILNHYSTVETAGRIVVPYLVNLLALDQLRRDRHPDEVGRYIDWYLAHLNYPDRFGLTGSIYDYRVGPDGREESLGTCDSVDGYAATFLLLVEAYDRRPGSPRIAPAEARKLADVAYLIAALQQANGLTTALPDTARQYLMDNAEALAGIRAFLALVGRYGWQGAPYWRQVAVGIERGIGTRLYNADQRDYDWAIENGVRRAVNWETLYPDALSQLFPILYGVIPPADPLRRHLWNTFLHHHGQRLTDLPLEQRIIVNWTREEMTR